jgi:hypothetical protein
MAIDKGGIAMNRNVPVAAAIVLSPCLAGSYVVSAQTLPMGFFITSAGTGQGADLGGLAGADKHCQTLAAAAGAGNRVARLSERFRQWRSAGGQRARSHRYGSLGQRERHRRGAW